MKRLLCTLAAITIMSCNAFAGGVNVTVNGNPIDIEGTIVDNRTLVPVRGVFEELGYIVDYDQATKTATILAKGVSVEMTQGNTYFTLNDKIVTPDVPPQIIDGRFMLPLRSVGEAVGLNVEWDPATKTAKISGEKAQLGLKIGGIVNLG